MAKIKGQDLRIYINSTGTGGPTAATVIALATSCSVQVSAQLEDSTTKDDSSDTEWTTQECTSKSWSVSVDALYSVDVSGKQNFIDIFDFIGKEVYVEFAKEGSPNRSLILCGTAIINDISVNAPNRQNATYSCQLTGVGSLSKTA